jgi:DNA-binding NarL/FixJ family response regulator
MKPSTDESIHGPKSQPANGHRLPRRQAQIAWLVAQGLTDKEVAAELGVSENTVGRHLGVIFRKIAIHSRTGLVAWSLKRKDH